MTLNNNKASERVLELRGLLHRLTTLTRDLDYDTELTEFVGVGRELWRVIELAHKRLNVIKDRLRDEVDGTVGNHRFNGPDGAEAVVHVAEPKVAVRKDFDIEALVRHFRDDEFVRSLFVLQISWKPVKNIKAIVDGLPHEEAQIIINALDMASYKPRITFIRGRKP